MTAPVTFERPATGGRNRSKVCVTALVGRGRLFERAATEKLPARTHGSSGTPRPLHGPSPLASRL
eukprot:scaffold13748_cov52-Phaeocystis_antarctica.AAC.1